MPHESLFITAMLLDAGNIHLRECAGHSIAICSHRMNAAERALLTGKSDTKKSCMPFQHCPPQLELLYTFAISIFEGICLLLIIEEKGSVPVI